MKIIIMFIAFLSIFYSTSAVEPATKLSFEDQKNLGGQLTGLGKYTDGVKGKAIVLADAYLTVPVGAITPAEGTATMWIKPLNWDFNNKEFIFLFSATDESKQGGRLILYKYQNPGLGLTFYYGNQGKILEDHIHTNTEKPEIKLNQWNFIAISWSKKEHLISLNINGKMVASTKIKDQMIFDKFTSFTLNAPPFTPADRNLETAFDEVGIFNSALSEDELLRIYNSNLPEQKIDLEAVKNIIFNLPKMKKPPTIDGNFTDSEWIGAARLSGFSEICTPSLQTDNQTEVYAGCDDKNLYFCTIAKIPGATQLVNEQRKRDSTVEADDAIELHLRPDTWKSDGFHCIFNVSGTIFDRLDGDAKWDGKWNIKTGIYEGLWISEISIPFTELKSQWHDKSEWGFNICRDWQVAPDIIFSSLSQCGSFFLPSGRMMLTTNDCFGRFFIDYEALFKRKLEFNLDVVNPGESNRKVQFSAEVLDHNGNILANEKKSAEIAGMATHSFKYSNGLSGLRASIIRISATDENKKIIFRQDLPLTFKDEVNIVLNTNISGAKLAVEVDKMSHFSIQHAKNITGKIIDKDNKIYAETALSGHPVATGVFNLENIPVGDYRIAFVFFDASGKKLFDYTSSYEHIGQPRWLKEKPGENAGVIWPYTPIKFVDNSLEIWGRIHKLGTTLLPEEITSQNISLFSVPPVFTAKVGGKKYQIENVKFTEVKKADDVVIMNFTASAGELNFSGKITFEYDGFFWYELNVTPDSGQATVEGLSLVMTLPVNNAVFYNAHFFSRENRAGKYKEPMYFKRFPSVWLGNLDIGLTFFSESFEYWRNTDVNTVYSVKKSDGNIIWEINFIDKETVIKKDHPFKYSFGIEANPVKPTPKNFRSWRVYNHKPYNIVHPWQVDRKTKKYPGDGGFFTPKFTSMEAFRGEIKRFRDIGAEFSVYLNPFLVSAEATEYKVFRREWRNPYNTYPQCPNSSFTDFIVWEVNQLINEGLQSVYVDSLGAVNCYNPEHGCGYTTETGEVGLTYPIRGMRNYMKRIYSLLHADGRDQNKNFLWAHMSARTCAPINAFVDFQASGEEQEHKMVTESNYLLLYPVDEFQVYFMKSSGVVPAVLPNLGRTGPEKVRYEKYYNDQLLLLTLLHDALIWVGYCDDDYAQMFYRYLDAWGYKDENLEFLSYRTQKAINCPENDIHISIYRLKEKNKALAIIGNWQDTPRTVKIDVNCEMLGIEGELFFSDLLTRKKLDPNALMLEPRGMVLMSVRGK